MRCHLTPFRMAIIKRTENKFGEDTEKLEPLCTAGRNIKWYSHSKT